jgi:hypothetical protein
MTKPWISDGHQRQSKRYKTIHEQLWEECTAKGWVKGEMPRDTSKRDSRQERSRNYRQNGGE